MCKNVNSLSQVPHKYFVGKDIRESENQRITKWFGLKGTLKIT